MKKVMNIVFAVMLMTAVVCIVGCKKEAYNGGGHYEGNYEYVDLGLPSGTLWATFNVGARVPEEYGDYVAWGEVDPKETYDWTTYRYCNGGQYQFTKYCLFAECGYNGFTDTLVTLQPMDDAATIKWGSEWCTPTREQLKELQENTISEWTTQNGVNGCLFVGSNGKSIFMPAAGSSFDGDAAGNYGYYWSSTLHKNTHRDHCRAWSLSFDSSPFLSVQGNGRSAGLSVRPVRVSQ